MNKSWRAEIELTEIYKDQFLPKIRTKKVVEQQFKSD